MLLACYTCGEEDVLLAMRTDSSVALLTKDGIIAVKEPKGYREAMRSAEREKWLQSMGVEVQNFKDSNTYTLVPLSEVPEGTPIFQLSWKYKLKRRSDGTLDKYKSRCVLMGNRMLTPVPNPLYAPPALDYFTSVLGSGLGSSMTLCAEIERVRE